MKYLWSQSGLNNCLSNIIHIYKKKMIPIEQSFKWKEKKKGSSFEGTVLFSITNCERTKTLPTKPRISRRLWICIVCHLCDNGFMEIELDYLSRRLSVTVTYWLTEGKKNPGLTTGSNDRTNEHVNKWINERTNKRADEGAKESTKKTNEGRKKNIEWTNKITNEWTKERTNERMNEYTNKWTNEW